LRAAVRFANAAASLKCARHGGRAGIPTRSEIAAAVAGPDEAHPAYWAPFIVAGEGRR
jgi:CHAT domain-containing protein